MKYHWEEIGEKIYSILKSSSKSVSMYDSKGNSTIDPTEATRFFAKIKSFEKKLDDIIILVACHTEGQDSHIDLKTPNLKNSKDFDKIHQVRNHLKKAIGQREGIKINWLVFDHAINPKDEAMHIKKDLNESLRGFFTNLKNKIFRRSDRSDIMKFNLPGTSDGTVFSYEVLPNGHVKWIPHNRESFLDAEKELLMAQAREDGMYAHVDSDGSIIWRSPQNIKENIPMKKIVDKSIAESKDVSKVYGTTKSSFQQIGEAKLIIRHSDAVNENVHGARSRKIRALFVENKIGERFAYPHLHVTGARAFARHISNGGTNHDTVAEKLYNLSEDYIKLRRSANSLRLNESANPVWAQRLKESMNEINRTLKSMHGPKGYKNVSTQLLEETSVELDEQQINSLRDQMAECCGCPADSAGYQDLATAARYIYAKGPVEEPVVFTWSARPDISSRIAEFANVSERLKWQLNELATSCTNEATVSKLQGIAEQIANGVMPNESDLNVIRRAYESSQSFIEEASAIPEETELNEFFDSFAEENIFAEEITDEGNEFSGALAAAKAKGEKTFSVDGKKYHVKEDGSVEEDVEETRMPASVIKNKQRLADMSDKEFAEKYKDRSDDDLKSMAWRHGYGKDSPYYVSKRKRGQEDVTNEGAIGNPDGLDECNMTMEGEYCPVHGMEECMSAQRTLGMNPQEDGNLDEVSMSPDDPDDWGFDDDEDMDDLEDPDDRGFDDDEDMEDLEDPDYGDPRDYDDYYDDRMHFADPGGRSALRAATPDNPRIHACPTCGHPNRLTAADVARGYQCDKCADAAETGREIDYYDDPNVDHDLEGEAEPLGMDKDDLYESQVARLKNLAGLK